MCRDFPGETHGYLNSLAPSSDETLLGMATRHAGVWFGCQCKHAWNSSQQELCRAPWSPLANVGALVRHADCSYLRLGSASLLRLASLCRQARAGG